MSGRKPRSSSLHSSSRRYACAPKVRENNQVPVSDALGPFPDETILSSIDRVFYLLGVKRMRSLLSLPVDGNESDIHSSSTDFSRAGGDQQKMIKPCPPKSPPSVSSCAPLAKSVPLRCRSPQQSYGKIQCICKKCRMSKIKPTLEASLRASCAKNKPNFCKIPKDVCVTQEIACNSASKSVKSVKEACQNKLCNQLKCCNVCKKSPSCSQQKEMSKPPAGLKVCARRRCLSANLKSDSQDCKSMKRSFSLCSLLSGKSPPPMQNKDIPLKEGPPKWMWTRVQNYSDGSKIFEVFKNSNVCAKPCEIDFENSLKLIFVVTPSNNVIPFESLMCHK